MSKNLDLAVASGIPITPFPLTQLPNDLISEVCLFLNDSDLQSFRRCSKFAKSIADSEALFKKKTEHFFKLTEQAIPPEVLTESKTDGWKKVYVERCTLLRLSKTNHGGLVTISPNGLSVSINNDGYEYCQANLDMVFTKPFGRYQVSAKYWWEPSDKGKSPNSNYCAIGFIEKGTAYTCGESSMTNSNGVSFALFDGHIKGGKKLTDNKPSPCVGNEVVTMALDFVEDKPRVRFFVNRTFVGQRELSPLTRGHVFSICAWGHSKFTIIPYTIPGLWDEFH